MKFTQVVQWHLPRPVLCTISHAQHDDHDQKPDETLASGS
jgi:hypothetical protein